MGSDDPITISVQNLESKVVPLNKRALAKAPHADQVISQKDPVQIITS